MANERTYLAWVRTAATVMVLGLGVAKFVEHSQARSIVAGALLVAVGGVGLVFGAIRYRAVAREIESGHFSIGAETRTPIVASAVLLVAIVAALVLLLA